MSEPIPNPDPRCPCQLGRSGNESAIIMRGPGTLEISLFLHCPLHGDYVQSLVKGGLKGLSL